MTKKCAGCGVVLQHQNELETGYIPKQKYDNSSYCMRCFKMTHYGVESNDILNFNNEDLICKINEKNIFTIFLIDYLNITKEVLEWFNKIRTKKTLVINKCETLPKFINKNNLMKNIKDKFNISDDIILKGKLGSRDYEIIYDYLKRNNIKEFILVGMSNVGKSTLINDLIKYTKSDNLKLTVNKKENTTLDFIELNLKEFTIFDSPGFILKEYKNIPKSKKIKSFIFQMKENETLNLVEDCFIKFGNESNINFFTNYLYEKKVKKDYKTTVSLENKIILPKNSDLIIKGVGFITFNEETVIFTNIEPKYLDIRKSLFRR